MGTKSLDREFICALVIAHKYISDKSNHVHVYVYIKIIQGR